MFKNVPVSLETELAGAKLRLETGLLAQQASSTVVATHGETVVMAAVVVGRATDRDYFPLQVIYEEKLYASGKIKGSRFIKREGRPSENAVLTGRMVDRSIRSLFDSQIRSEVQVIITVLSIDEVNQPDTLAVLAASSALKIAIQDFKGPVSSVRVGRMKDEVDYPYILAPTYEEMDHSDLDLVISGDGTNVMMLEAGADILAEDVISQSLELASEELTRLTMFQSEFVSQVQSNLIPDGYEKFETIKLIGKDFNPKSKEYWSHFRADLEEVLYSSKSKRLKAEIFGQFKSDHIDILKNTLNTANKINEPDMSYSDLEMKVLEVLDQIETDFDQQEKIIAPYVMSLANDLSELTDIVRSIETGMDKYIKELMRENILNQGKRFDLRPLDKTREIKVQVGVLPRTHGSSLFQRGETQVLNILTLGTQRDAQILDEMEDFEETTKRYMHHYNFPHYSVGETGRYGAPGRREIGHGALAEKALLPVLPKVEDFAYTMRLVSECLGSNGSTSMASTCGSCLSLMDGGVPIKDLVAGVAMGLALDSESGKFEVLTDIQGIEDHYGDMDFKITGTKDGITAIQLDNKVAGLTVDILKQAILRSKEARLHILGIMSESISEPRKEISKYAPIVEQTQIPIDKIGDVIGPSGKIIKSIIAEFGVEIEIGDEDGKTFVYGRDMTQVRKAMDYIKALVKEYEIGEIVDGEIVRIEDYGAFVRLEGGKKDGMIHVSEIMDKRVENIRNHLKMKQKLKVKIIGIKDGKINLSLKGL